MGFPPSLCVKALRIHPQLENAINCLLSEQIIEEKDETEFDMLENEEGDEVDDDDDEDEVELAYEKIDDEVIYIGTKRPKKTITIPIPLKKKIKKT